MQNDAVAQNNCGLNAHQVAENKNGIHALISSPRIYNLIQWAAGEQLYRNRMVRDYIKPFDGCKILDIGCGTGGYIHHIDNYCNNYEYYGFDGEAIYIDYATRHFANKPNLHFFHKILTEENVKEFSDCDLVIATGVMHHLDDPIVVSLLRIAKQALKPGGRLITYDTGKFDKMSPLEKFFLHFDRGRSIRNEQEYAALVKQIFPKYNSHTPRLTYYNSRNIVFECFNN
jgi:SAM-dependent methyltransferase